jgi:N-acetylglucosaminyl-diphospho-decaprenol L-rhamnosyltransferase
MTDISIVTVNYNGKGFIEDCLESISRGFGREGDISYEAIIVDNASTDSSREYIERFCRENSSFRLIKNSVNQGFGSASNKGAEKAAGEFLLFLNPDCRIIDGDIGRAVDFYRKSGDAGVLGVKVMGKDGELQLSSRAFPTLARQFYESFFCSRIFRSSPIFGSYFMTWWDHSSARQVDWLSGSFMLVENRVFKEAGGFDRDYFMYSEDTALCLELVRKGYKNYYYPYYAAEHADAGIASRDKASRESQVWQSRRTYFSKNHSAVQAAVFSLIYLAGIINRIIIFGAGSIFSKSARTRAASYLRAIYMYYRKRRQDVSRV